MFSLFKFKSNVINSQVVKAKTDKLMKRALKDAKKRIKRGELLDCRSLGLHLRSIEARYDYIKADINNSNRVGGYTAIRARKIAETRQLMEFYSGDYAELTNLYRIVARKAEQAGRMDDFKEDRVGPPSMEKLKTSFNKLTDDEGEENSQRGDI